MTTDLAERYLDHRTNGIRRVDLNDAACANRSDELFFGLTKASTAIAKGICRSCPVRWDCLVYAIDTRQPDGIWGGLTPDERLRLRRTVGSLTG